MFYIEYLVSISERFFESEVSVDLCLFVVNLAVLNEYIEKEQIGLKSAFSDKEWKVDTAKTPWSNSWQSPLEFYFNSERRTSAGGY
jgi:hypothetical protein